MGEIVENAESLSDCPDAVSGRGEPPEGTRETLSPAAGIDHTEQNQPAQRKLNKIGVNRAGRIGAQCGDHTDVRQQQQPGNSHDDTRTWQSIPLTAMYR
jgi:hypothetical protein